MDRGLLLFVTAFVRASECSLAAEALVLGTSYGCSTHPTPTKLCLIVRQPEWDAREITVHPPPALVSSLTCSFDIVLKREWLIG